MDSATQRALIVMIISLLVLCIIFYFIFLPASKQSLLLTKQIKEKKINLTNAEVIAGEYAHLEEQINKSKNQLEILKNKLFWEKDISRFLNELTQLAIDLPIEFVSLKPESVKLESVSLSILKDKKDNKESKSYVLAQVPISVILRTSYNNLIGFLRRIEEADKFINIDNLSIESEQRDIYKHNIKMNLIIRVKEEG